MLKLFSDHLTHFVKAELVIIGRMKKRRYRTELIYSYSEVFLPQSLGMQLQYPAIPQMSPLFDHTVILPSLKAMNCTEEPVRDEMSSLSCDAGHNLHCIHNLHSPELFIQNCYQPSLSLSLSPLKSCVWGGRQQSAVPHIKEPFSFS